MRFIRRQETEVIKSVISEMQETLNLGKRFHQELEPKFRLLDIKIRLLEEALELSKLKSIPVEPEIQLRDLWFRDGKEY